MKMCFRRNAYIWRFDADDSLLAVVETTKDGDATGKPNSRARKSDGGCMSDVRLGS